MTFSPWKNIKMAVKMYVWQMRVEVKGVGGNKQISKKCNLKHLWHTHNPIYVNIYTCFMKK